MKSKLPFSSKIPNLLTLLCRFMGDSKRSVKNKARVEGSICSSYLHRETTYFCSYYFNRSLLSPRNRRNEVVADCERHPLALSVFCLPGRHGGGESSRWLTDEEFNSAHVHVLINCTEVKPYLEYVYRHVLFFYPSTLPCFLIIQFYQGILSRTRIFCGYTCKLSWMV